MLVHINNSSTWEAEARGLGFCGPNTESLKNFNFQSVNMGWVVLRDELVSTRQPYPYGHYLQEAAVHMVSELAWCTKLFLRSIPFFWALCLSGVSTISSISNTGPSGAFQKDPSPFIHGPSLLRLPLKSEWKTLPPCDACILHTCKNSIIWMMLKSATSSYSSSLSPLGLWL